MRSRFHCIAVASSILFVSLSINCENSLGISEEKIRCTDEIQSLTESDRVRMVWLKNGELENGGGTLVGFDSKGKVVHSIVQSTSTFIINRPIVYKNGTRVAFTNTFNRNCYETYSISWDGSDLKYIGEGECSNVWLEQQTNTNWFIIRKGGADTNQPIIRVNENNTSQKILIWDKKPVGSVHSRVWFSLSGDGKRAAGCFPWSIGDSYLLKNPLTDTDNSRWVSGSRGCWYSMAPDLSYSWFHLDWDNVFNGHTSIRLFKDTVSLGVFELLSRGKPEEHFHTKFSSNSGKLIVASVRQENLNSVYYDSTEIVVGRLNENLQGFSGWLQITNDSTPDYYPDLWVDVDEALSVCNKPLILGKSDTAHVDPDEQMSFLSPFKNDTLTKSDSISMNWVVKNPGLVSAWLIEYSVNNGKRWYSCNTGSGFDPNIRSYKLSCAIVAQKSMDSSIFCHVRVHDYFNESLKAVVGPIHIK